MWAKSQQSDDAIPRTSAAARVTTHLSLGKSRRVAVVVKYFWTPDRALFPGRHHLVNGWRHLPVGRM